MRQEHLAAGAVEGERLTHHAQRKGHDAWEGAIIPADDILRIAVARPPGDQIGRRLDAGGGRVERAIQRDGARRRQRRCRVGERHACQHERQHDERYDQSIFSLHNDLRDENVLFWFTWLASHLS